MRQRIVICLGLLFALCLLGDAIAMLWLHRSTTQLGALVEFHRIQSLRTNLASAAVQVKSDYIACLYGDHTVEEHAASFLRFEKALNRCGACHHPPNLKAKLDEVRTTAAAYRSKTDELFTDGAPHDAAVAMKNEAFELANRLTQKATAMADEAAGHLDARNTDVASGIRTAWLVLTGTLLALLGAGALVSFHLKGRLTKPVESLLDGIERVGRGDTDYRFSTDADGEFRVLANALNEAYLDLKNAQDGVLQAEKMAAVGRLAAGVAHEVGNPLASISSIAQVMRRHGDGDDHSKQVKLILEQVTRISRVVRDLLDFSRPPHDEKMGRVEVGLLLEHAAGLLGYDKRAERVRIVCTPDPDLRTVRADSDRLLLVFTNIMMNALDALCAYRQDGSGTLTVTAEQVADQVVVRFEDDGPGMTQEQIANAFEPFFTTKEPGAGTGLGLWICYQVIRKCQGSILIDSRLGQGTALVVALPCNGSEPAEEAAVTTSAAD